MHPQLCSAPHRRVEPVTTRGLAVPALLLAAMTLAGCAQLQATVAENWEGEARAQFSGVDKHSAYPAVKRTEFEQVNLIQLIDPSGHARLRYAAQWPSDKEIGKQYDLVLADFRERLAGMDPMSAMRHRNAVQDRILAVSTSRCNVFKTYLRRQQSDTNFLLGSITTVAGALGAILPGVRASRNLAGTAGIFSGVQAEFNSSYYSNLAAHVIVQGIEVRQQRLASELMKERSTRLITDYGMEAAIKDALYIDGTCSTVVGLIEAAESIKEVTNPGLPRAAEVIASVKAMSAIAQADKIGTLAQSGELDKLLKLTAPKSSPLVVGTMASTDAPQEATRAIMTAATASVRLSSMVEELAATLIAGFAAAQAQLDPGDRHPNQAFGKAVADVFKDQQKGLGTSAGLPECEKALQVPMQTLTRAQTARDLTPDGSPQRIKAQAELLSAAASAQAAAALVEWRLKKAHDHLVASAGRWRAALNDKGVKGKQTPTALGVESTALNMAALNPPDCAAPK